MTLQWHPSGYFKTPAHFLPHAYLWHRIPPPTHTRFDAMFFFAQVTVHLSFDDPPWSSTIMDEFVPNPDEREYA